MSEQTWKIGLGVANALITRADVDPPGQKARWTTEDLADFCQGIVEESLALLATLRPENVTSEGDGTQDLELRRIALRAPAEM